MVVIRRPHWCRSLASLNVDEYMAYSSSGEGEGEGKKPVQSKVHAVKRVKRLPFAQRGKGRREELIELDEELDHSEGGSDEELLYLGLSENSDSGEEGQVEPRPLTVTNYKYKVGMQSDTIPMVGPYLPVPVV